MTREQRKQLHDSRSGPGRHRHRALFITHASSNTSRRLRRTEIRIVLPRWFAPITPPALNCTFAPMQPAARSHKHTRNTPPVQSEKKGTQNKTAQLLSVPHRPPRLSCPRWRHIAWHWTPSMRCVPPCRAHIHAPHHPRHTNSSSFDARRLLPLPVTSREDQHA